MRNCIKGWQHREGGDRCYDGSVAGDWEVGLPSLFQENEGRGEEKLQPLPQKFTLDKKNQPVDGNQRPGVRKI